MNREIISRKKEESAKKEDREQLKELTSEGQTSRVVKLFNNKKSSQKNELNCI